METTSSETFYYLNDPSNDDSDSNNDLYLFKRKASFSNIESSFEQTNRQNHKKLNSSKNCENDTDSCQELSIIDYLDDSMIKTVDVSEYLPGIDNDHDRLSTIKIDTRMGHRAASRVA